MCEAMPENLSYLEDAIASQMSTDLDGLKGYYRAFLSLAAGFFVAEEDWRRGIVCDSHQENLERADAFKM